MKSETYEFGIGNIFTGITYFVVLFFIFFGIALHDTVFLLAGIAFLLLAFFTGGSIEKNDKSTG